MTPLPAASHHAFRQMHEIDMRRYDRHARQIGRLAKIARALKKIGEKK